MTDHLVTASTAATELVDESAPVDRPTAVDEVVVLDYGGQYSQLIARRVRECGVFSELLPHHVGAEEVRRRKPKGLILSGGPASVYADGARRPHVGRRLLDDMRRGARRRDEGVAHAPANSSSRSGCAAAAAPRDPIPTPWALCSCLPSVCSAGATISSARLNSAMSR